MGVKRLLIMLLFLPLLTLSTAWSAEIHGNSSTQLLWFNDFYNGRQIELGEYLQLSVTKLDKDGKIAIYGWHSPWGIPIQSLSTVHGAGYADYSHGIRLVGSTLLLDGESRSIYDVLENPKLAGIPSDEGRMGAARQLMALRQQPLRPVDTSQFSTLSAIQKKQ